MKKYQTEYGDTYTEWMSYPEKYMYNLLTQLGVVFKHHKTFEWSQKREYDFYIPSMNCIIETHGQQHYDGNFKVYGGRNAEEEQANDKVKRDLAYDNGIISYIEVDCRYSRGNWIKKHILLTDICSIFNISDINWTDCDIFATKSATKQIWDFWNSLDDDLNFRNVKYISEQLGYNYTFIQSSLRKGRELGICNYDSIEQIRRVAKMSSKLRERPIILIEQNREFCSVTECCRILTKEIGVKFNRSEVFGVCSGTRLSYKGFHFKYVNPKDEDLMRIDYINNHINKRWKGVKCLETNQTFASTWECDKFHGYENGTTHDLTKRKKLSENGLTFILIGKDDEDYERRHPREKVNKYKKIRCKEFDITLKGATEWTEYFIKNHNIKMDSSHISKICRRGYGKCKGYHFEYV